MRKEDYSLKNLFYVDGRCKKCGKTIKKVPALSMEETLQMHANAHLNHDLNKRLDKIRTLRQKMEQHYKVLCDTEEYEVASGVKDCLEFADDILK